MRDVCCREAAFCAHLAVDVVPEAALNSLEKTGGNRDGMNGRWIAGSSHGMGLNVLRRNHLVA